MAGRPVYYNPLEAIADIPDGATVMTGGFAARGAPVSLLLALRQKGVREPHAYHQRYQQWLGWASRCLLPH